MKPLIRSDKDTRDLRLHLQEEKHEDDLWLDETSPIVLELRADAPGDLFLLAGGYRLMSAKPTIHFGPVFVFPLHAFIGGEADRFNWVCRQNIANCRCVCARASCGCVLVLVCASLPSCSSSCVCTTDQLCGFLL